METTGSLMVFEFATNLLTICLKDTALTVVIFLSLTVNFIYIQNAKNYFVIMLSLVLNNGKGFD